MTEFFLYHSKAIVVLSLNLKRYFTCDHFSQSYEGLKVAILTNLGQLTRDFFLAINDLIRLRNRSKLVERSLFAIIDLLQGAKFFVLYFIWRVGG